MSQLPWAAIKNKNKSNFVFCVCKQDYESVASYAMRSVIPVGWLTDCVILNYVDLIMNLFCCAGN